MKIQSAEFVKSAFEKKHWVEGDLPEIAFLGRSNVGKSSLINSLLNRKGLARTSNTPGRTQSINYFLINETFYFVDLPGYGYAKVPLALKQDWGKMAEDYLSSSKNLKLSVQLIDSRHEPKSTDIQLNEWLNFYAKPHVVIATKADKLSAKKLSENISEIERKFSQSKVIPFSSVKNTGRDELWKEIRFALEKV